MTALPGAPAAAEEQPRHARQKQSDGRRFGQAYDRAGGGDAAVGDQRRAEIGGVGGGLRRRRNRGGTEGDLGGERKPLGGGGRPFDRRKAGGIRFLVSLKVSRGLSI